MSLVDAFRAELSSAGLNLIAALPAERYDRDVPERFQLRKRYPQYRSLVVIGNGGGDFWKGFRAYCAEHPDFFDRNAHPLDRYTTSVIERIVSPLLTQAQVCWRLVYPFQFDADPVSFVHLGALAGLGARSLLGVLVHPEYGPWIALRAAVLLDCEIEPTPVAAFDPCGTCVQKPCVAACPAAAVGPKGWDVPTCTAHRSRETDDCADRCHARWNCVYGQAHRYPIDAMAYHQRRALDAMQGRHVS